MKDRPEGGTPNDGRQSGQGFWRALLRLLAGERALGSRFAQWTGLSLDSALQLKKIQRSLRERWTAVEARPLRSRRGASEIWMSPPRKTSGWGINQNPEEITGKNASSFGKAPAQDEEIRGLDDIFTRPMSALLIEESILEIRSEGKRPAIRKVSVSPLIASDVPIPDKGALPIVGEAPAASSAGQSPKPGNLKPSGQPLPVDVSEQAVDIPASPSPSVTMPTRVGEALRFDESLRKQVCWPQSGPEDFINPATSPMAFKPSILPSAHQPTQNAATQKSELPVPRPTDSSPYVAATPISSSSTHFLKPKPELPLAARPLSPSKPSASSVSVSKSHLIQSQTHLSRDGLRVREVRVERSVNVQESVSVRFSEEKTHVAQMSEELSGLGYLSRNTHMIRNSLTSLVDRYFQQSELEDDASFY